MQKIFKSLIKISWFNEIPKSSHCFIKHFNWIFWSRAHWEVWVNALKELHHFRIWSRSNSNCRRGLKNEFYKKTNDLQKGNAKINLKTVSLEIGKGLLKGRFLMIYVWTFTLNKLLLVKMCLFFSIPVRTSRKVMLRERLVFLN